MRPLPQLAAAHYPVLVYLLYGAALAYAVALPVATASPRAARHFVGLGAVVHAAATLGRGLVIGYLPLTNKMESFSAAALSLAIVTALAWHPSLAYLAPLLVLLSATMGAALAFPLDLHWPAPLLRTVWYPLHVPLSFVAYALWAAAAAGAVAWAKDRDAVWLNRIDKLALLGFGVFSVAMICGGVWGVVAWGAYFMWDPKIVWSVILWFFYATFVHVRLTPSLSGRAWVRPALALLGLACVLVAFVGTSFLFGKSTHAF